MPDTPNIQPFRLNDLLNKNPVLGNQRTPNYPHKIFSLSETYMPKNMSELFDLCAYFFTTSSLVHPTLYKMSEYPITRFKYSGGDRQDQDRMQSLVENQWSGRRLLIETGLYYHTFGNCFTVMAYVPKRYLRCPRCHNRYQVVRLPYRWINYVPHARCNKCKHDGEFEFVKIDPRHQAFVRPIIFDPRHIKIRYNPTTGRRTYLYRLPPSLKRQIAQGDPYVLEDTPDVFIDAAKKGKLVELDRRNVYHFARPGLSASNDGFGMPLIAPVMQDLYYQKTLRRAQEAISLSHIVPLMILFPQATAAVNPARQLDMNSMVKEVEAQLARGRRDPNYIPIMPHAMEIQHVGGNARSLMITPELEMLNSTIINGMLAPQELVQGGLTWSGSSISLRIIENHFINYRHDIEQFLEYATDRACAYLKWPTNVKVELHPFKMADDVQRLQLLMAASQAGAVSTSRYLDEMDIDVEEDHKRRMEELDKTSEYSTAQQRSQAISQGEAMIMQARYQQRAQKAMQDEQMQQMQGEAGGVPLEDPMMLAQIIAELLTASPEQMQRQAMQTLSQMPTLNSMVQQALQALYGNPQAQQDQAQGQDDESIPMPGVEPGAEQPANNGTPPGQVPPPPNVGAGAPERRPPQRAGGI